MRPMHCWKELAVDRFIIVDLAFILFCKIFANGRKVNDVTNTFTASAFDPSRIVLNGLC